MNRDRSLPAIRERIKENEKLTQYGILGEASMETGLLPKLKKTKFENYSSAKINKK